MCHIKKPNNTTLININIFPLIGIDIENVGKVNLGLNKAEVLKRLGLPSQNSNEKQFYYDHLEFRIDFDHFDHVEFIEFIYGPFPEKTHLLLYNIDPFGIGADSLKNILSIENNGKVDESEAEFAYSFLNISVGVWRDLTPELVEESILEMKLNGEYEENKSWLLEDLEKAKNFWTIGIGIPSYYS